MADEESVSFAFALLVCLSSLRSKILFEGYEVDLKSVSNLYDKVNDSITQFTQFLRYHTKENSSLYSSLLPTNALLKLIINYK